MNRSCLQIYFTGAIRRFLAILWWDLPGLLNFFSFRPHQKRVIIFQTYSDHLVQFYKPVIEQLVNDETLLIYVHILFHPFFGFSHTRRTRQYVINILGFSPSFVLSTRKFLWKKPYMLVCNDVYCRFPILPCRKVLLAHGVGFTTRKVQKSWLRKTAEDFDYMFVSGNFERELVGRFLKNSPQIVVTGLPFVDSLHQHCHPQSRHRVLFALNWIIRSYGDMEAKNAVLYIIEELLSLDIVLILKPHAVSRFNLPNRSMSWETILDRYSHYKNIRIDTRIDDIPAMLEADLLVTDVSGRAFNFMICDKPVVLLPVPQSYMRHPLSAIHRKEMEKFAYRLSHLQDLTKIVRHALAHPQEMSAARLESRDYVFSHLGNATEIQSRLLAKL